LESISELSTRTIFRTPLPIHKSQVLII